MEERTKDKYDEGDAAKEATGTTKHTPARAKATSLGVHETLESKAKAKVQVRV